MKDHDGLNLIINDLKSTDWATFSKAQESLNSIYHISDIRYLYEESLRLRDESLKKFLAQKISDLTPIIDKIDFLGQLLFYLCCYEADHNSTIHKDAKIYLDQFFDNKQINLFVKVECIRFVWNKNKSETKFYLTKKIAEKKYFQLSSLIFANLQSADDKLVDLSIKTLKYLNDGRAPRFLNKILKGNNKSQVISSLLTIGEIGQWFDAINIFKLIKHDDIQIRQTAIWAFSNLLGIYSIPILYKIYFKENPIIKKQIISRIGSINSKWSTKALLRIYKNEIDANTFKEISWALYEINVKNKLNPLLKLYRTSTQDERHKLITLLADCPHPLIFPILFEYVEYCFINNTNQGALTHCFEALSYYNNPTGIELLKRYVLQNKFDIGKQALITLFRHSDFNIFIFLNDFLDTNPQKDHPYHQIIINHLQKSDIAPQNLPQLENYLLFLLRSEGEINIEKIIEICAKYPSPLLLQKIYDILETTKDQFLKKFICHNILSTFSMQKIYGRELLMFLRNIFFVDQSKDRSFPEAFFVIFLKSIRPEEIDHYNYFLINYIPTIDSQCTSLRNHLDSSSTTLLFHILLKHNLRFDQNIFKNLKNIYQSSDNKSHQIAVLKILIKSQNSHAIRFAFRRLIHDEKMSDDILPLLNEMIQTEVLL